MVIVSVVAHLASMHATSGVLRRLLSGAGVRIGRGQASALTYASFALASTVPAGSIAAVGWATQRLRAWRVEVGAATVAVVAGPALSLATFSVPVAVAATQPGAAVGSALLWASLGAIAVIVALALLCWGRRRGATGASRQAASGLLSRVPTQIVDLLRSAAAARVGPKTWALGAVGSLASWAADVACLYAAVRAVGGEHVALIAVTGALVAGALAGSITPCRAGSVLPTPSWSLHCTARV